MSDMFRLGEEAIVVNLDGDVAKNNGLRVTLIGTLRTRNLTGLGIMLCYKVELPNGEHFCVSPGGLIRPAPRRKDMDTKVTWADCAWKPKEKGNVNDY